MFIENKGEIFDNKKAFKSVPTNENTLKTEQIPLKPLETINMKDFSFEKEKNEGSSESENIEMENNVLSEFQDRFNSGFSRSTVMYFLIFIKF